MRSASSTWAGRPGGHAAGDVLHKRGIGDDEPLAGPPSPLALVAAPEVLQLDRFDVGFQRRLPTPADGCVRTPISAARTLPECRPASSRWRRGRAAPGSSAGPRRRPAGASRRSAAARAGDGAPATRRAPGVPTRAAGGGRRRSTGAGRTSRGTAPASRSARRQRRPPARPGSGRSPRSAGSPAGTKRVLPPLPSTRTCSPSKSIDADVEVHELLGAQAGGVGELEQRAVAQRERRVGRDAVEQRGDLGRLQDAWAAARRAAARDSRSAGFCSQLAVLDERAEQRAQRRRACARRCVGACPLGSQRGGVAAQQRAASPPAGASRCASAQRANCRAVDRVGAAGLLGGAAAAQVLVQQRQRAAPVVPRGCSPLGSAAVAVFFIDTDTGQVATRRQLVEAGVATEATEPAAALAADPGHGRCDDHVVRGDAQAGAGDLHRCSRYSPRRPPCLSAASAAGRRSRSTSCGAGPRPTASGDVDGVPTATWS